MLKNRSTCVVEAQITLANKIGENQGYQEYLIKIRTVEAQEAVGKEQAKNLGNANIKVIANAGTVDGGIKSAMDLFSAKGGTGVGAALEALSNTDIGKQLLDKFVKPKVINETCLFFRCTLVIPGVQVPPGDVLFTAGDWCLVKT